ncbi:TRAP transporter small permease subunit [bacterium]|nr:TRAP transporter small permease subunit [bacterium]
MKRTLKALSGLFENLSVVFLVIMSVCVFAQIILRNFFSMGSSALEELGRFSLVSLVFLMMRKQQIIVDFVISRLPASARRIMDTLIRLVCLAVSVFLIVAISRIMVMNYNVRTAALKMPNYIFYIPIAAGLAFDVLASIDQFIALLAGKEDSK